MPFGESEIFAVPLTFGELCGLAIVIAQIVRWVTASG